MLDEARSQSDTPKTARGSRSVFSRSRRERRRVKSSRRSPTVFHHPSEPLSKPKVSGATKSAEVCTPLLFPLEASSGGRSILEAQGRAPGYDEYRYRRTTDDLHCVRAEEDPRHGSEPARSHYEHLTLLPRQRVQSVLPVATLEDAGLHRDVVRQRCQRLLLCLQRLRAPLLGDEALRVVADLRGVHLPIANHEGGKPHRHAVPAAQLHRGLKCAMRLHRPGRSEEHT